MPLSNAYPWRSLTAAVSDKTSPLRLYLDSRFPNRAPLQTAYRKSVGSIRVPGGDANAGTLGAAFDFLARAVLDPTSVPTVALGAFSQHHDQLAAVLEVIDVANAFSDCRDTEAPEELLRAVWALALCTEVFRAGLMPGSPLQELLAQDDFTPDGLLRLASPNALEQLQQLHLVAVDALYRHLPAREVGYFMGPTFDGSGLCSADADFIVDGRIVELKVRLGALNANTGQRSDALTLEDIYQMLAYVLWDRSDQYGIKWVSFYSARYGQLTTWSLYQYMHVLSGQELDLATERATVWELLSAGAYTLPA